MNENLARRALEWKLWDYLHISFRREAEGGTAAQKCQCSCWLHSLAQELAVYLETLWFCKCRYVPMCESVRDTETHIPEMSLGMESFISPFIGN